MKDKIRVFIQCFETFNYKTRCQCLAFSTIGSSCGRLCNANSSVGFFLAGKVQKLKKIEGTGVGTDRVLTHTGHVVEHRS